MAEGQKAKRAPQGQKPFYLVYKIDDGKVVNLCFSRKTDDILDAMTANEGASTLKLVPPAGAPRAPKAS